MRVLSLIAISTILVGCQTNTLFQMQPPLDTTTTIKESRSHGACGLAPLMARNAYNSSGKLKSFSDTYKNTLEELAAAAANTSPKSQKEFEAAIASQGYKKKKEHYLIYQEMGNCLKSSNKLTPALEQKLIEIREGIKKEHTEAEKALFLRRTGGLHFCTNNLIKQFSMGRIQQTPNKSCMYYSEGYLKAAQVLEGGILADSAFGEAYPGDGHMIFIKNPNRVDVNIADGQYLQPGYFAYDGLYKYTNLLLSQKTVHAFKRLDLNRDDLFKDIYFYDGY